MNKQASLFAHSTPTNKKPLHMMHRRHCSKFRPSPGGYGQQQHSCRDKAFACHTNSVDNTDIRMEQDKTKKEASFFVTEPVVVGPAPQKTTKQVVIGGKTYQVLSRKESCPRSSPSQSQQEKSKTTTTKTRGERKIFTTMTPNAGKQVMVLPELSTTKFNKTTRSMTKLKKPSLWQEPGVPTFIFVNDETSVSSPVSCVSMAKTKKREPNNVTLSLDLPCSVVAVLHHLDNDCSTLTTSQDGSGQEHKTEEGKNSMYEYAPRDYSPLTVGDEDCF